MTTYEPRDALDEMSSDDTAEQIADRMTRALQSADLDTIDAWLTSLVELMKPTTRMGAWVDREATYGGVRLRGRPTTGPSRAIAPPALTTHRLAAQHWLDTFKCIDVVRGERKELEIEILDARNDAPLSDTLNAIEAYIASHGSGEYKDRDVVGKKFSDVNSLLTKQPWYKSWVQHRAKRPRRG